MKKKYLVVSLLLMFLGIINVQALTVGDCKVLVSFKLNSSLDEEKYICQGQEYGENTDSIYYSGKGNTISLNNFEAYYFTNWDDEVTIDINGNNSISLLHISDSKFKVSGSGSLKFKQNSFVKKVINGEPVYQYVNNDKTVLINDKKIYEGTTLEFEENYELLKEKNKLPDEYNLADYELVSVVDFAKMTSVVVTESWIDKKIDTNLKTSLNDGFGIIEYVEPIKVEEKVEQITNETKLESDNVILISEKKLDKKYKLKEENLKEKEVATKIANSINDAELISFYDVSIYNGKKEVSIKNGKYVIKIKIDEDIDRYQNYQIIYVSDDGEIKEYIDGVIEGSYMVFQTTHLSQYGIIANPIVDEIAVNVNNINSSPKNGINNIGNILKISILAFIALAFITLITFVVKKSDLLSKKQKRKKRA